MNEGSDIVEVPVPQAVELAEALTVGISRDGKIHWQLRGLTPLDALKYVSILQKMLLEEVFKNDKQS